MSAGGPQSMARLAITGGRGRLAPLVARFLAARGWDVSLYSREPGPGLGSLDKLPAALTGFDALVHCGWSTVPFTAEEDPGLAERSDLPLLRTLLRSAPDHLQFVFLSTAAVYGNTGVEPATETDLPRPRGQYAAGKLAAEELVAKADGTILRVTNLIGEQPGSDRPQGVVPRLIRAAHTGELVTFWGDGSATKDYLHCSDFLTALSAVLDRKLTGIYNVSSGISVSLRDLVNLVKKETGRPVPVAAGPAFSWDVSYSAVSSEKLRQHAGWRAALSPVEAVRDFLRQGNR